VESVSVLRRRDKLFHECFTGDVREDRPPIEEFKKVPSHPGEHEMILRLLIGGVSFKLLVGVTFGVECSTVRPQAVGPVSFPFIVRGRLEREGGGEQFNSRHGECSKSGYIPRR